MWCFSKNGEKFKVIAKEKIDDFPYDIEIKEFEIKDTKGFDVVIDASGNEEVTKKLLENKNFPDFRDWDTQFLLSK